MILPVGAAALAGGAPAAVLVAAAPAVAEGVPGVAAGATCDDFAVGTGTGACSRSHACHSSRPEKEKTSQRIRRCVSMGDLSEVAAGRDARRRYGTGS